MRVIVALEAWASVHVVFTDDFTVELLNLHEAELKTLDKYYEDHRELFDGVRKWQDNWTLYLELDVSYHQLQQSVFREPDVVTCFFLLLEKKQWPFKVQQQRGEPSQRREAENWPAEEFAQGQDVLLKNFVPLHVGQFNT